MNYEQARFNMIEQQIRPWDVLDQDVLKLLEVVKREDFVPAALRDIAFTDVELPLSGAAIPNKSQHMMFPRVEARILQALAPKKNENVLEIGTGSGYMAALLAYNAHHVTTVEFDANLAQSAQQTLRANGVTNVEVVNADGAQGWSAAAPYDVICISGALAELPQAFQNQLKVGGRLAAFVGGSPVMEAVLITRVSETEFRRENLFETQVTYLVAPQPSSFKF
ncbi:MULTISPECIES: protein-L-isoaspartate O-methyltransferase family protein [Pandoraea]|uniref:Protein-L-isoaspartate O-methyltransferase n=1 Tax=Pandoraea commovens TaxID=2508289 RepID=A0A5E4ZCW8_9BURK|nr:MULTISPECIES: protein-L-isoaspartate O-methyltransferase [Pandoraea]MCE4061801.1 protein-L-isoaspartate O-methyltransferase [Pandoraea sputorum]UVA78861.1 protein-L-isoaspartate O-methyltransferase [Pandoraea commovens]VVE58517.1 protein-L-isoaspartate O-methyltransferase [Pandoraea commovens]